MLGLGNSASENSECDVHNLRSLSFDGTNDNLNADNICSTLYAAFTDAEDLNTNLAFSIAMWVTVETMSSTGVVFNLRVGTSSDNHMNLQWHGSQNKIRWTCKFNGTAEVAADGETSSSGLAENDGKWHHIVGTVADGGNCELWINGVKRSTHSVAQTLVGEVSQCNIGTNTTENNFWNGNIDEVGMWTRVLTDAEILAISRGGGQLDIGPHSAYSTNLVALYRFEEQGVTVAANEVTRAAGTGATMVNSPTASTNVPWEANSSN